MKIIPLNQGKETRVDDEDFGALVGFPWFAQPAWNGTFYVVRNAVVGPGKRTTIRLHRQLMGLTEPEVWCDHRNGDTLDNQKHNLRVTDRRGNQRAYHRPKVGFQSAFRGVTWHRNWKRPAGWWRARIYLPGHKCMGLGYFRDEKQAAQAYDTAALALFGEFAQLNFPKIVG